MRSRIKIQDLFLALISPRADELELWHWVMPIYVDMEMGVDEWGFYTPESLNTFDSHRRMIVDVSEWNWVPLWESIFADVAKKEELDEKAKAFCVFFSPLFLVELVRWSHWCTQVTGMELSLELETETRYPERRDERAKFGDPLVTCCCCCCLLGGASWGCTAYLRCTVGWRHVWRVH